MATLNLGYGQSRGRTERDNKTLIGDEFIMLDVTMLENHPCIPVKWLFFLILSCALTKGNPIGPGNI
jgi:hypothetical protein